MNMTEMKNSIAQLGREIHDDAAKLAAMAMDDTQKDEDVTKQRGALDAKVARLNALQAAYNASWARARAIFGLLATRRRSAPAVNC